VIDSCLVFIGKANLVSVNIYDREGELMGKRPKMIIKLSSSVRRLSNLKSSLQWTHGVESRIRSCKWHNLTIISLLLMITSSDESFN